MEVFQGVLCPRTLLIWQRYLDSVGGSPNWTLTYDFGPLRVGSPFWVLFGESGSAPESLEGQPVPDQLVGVTPLVAASVAVWLGKAGSSSRGQDDQWYHRKQFHACPRPYWETTGNTGPFQSHFEDLDASLQNIDVLRGHLFIARGSYQTPLCRSGLNWCSCQTDSGFIMDLLTVPYEKKYLFFVLICIEQGISTSNLPLLWWLRKSCRREVNWYEQALRRYRISIGFKFLSTEWACVMIK